MKMIKPARSSPWPGVFWLVDIAGAAMFAGGVASGAGAAIRGGPMLGPAALVVSGAIVRLSGIYGITSHAVADATQTVAGIRRRLWPTLLGARNLSPLASGASASLAIDHVSALEARATRFVPARTGAMIGPLAVAAIVAPASWVAAAIMLATLIPFVAGMILAGTAARRASERQLDALRGLSELFFDRLTHLPLIRHFGAEERVVRQVRLATKDVAQRTIAVLRVAFLSSAVLEFFAALAVALVAVYCGFSLLGLLPFPSPETLDLVPAFFALAMAPEFYMPMRRMAAAYHEKQLGDAAGAALEPYLATDDIDTPHSEQHPGFDGLRVTGLVLAFPQIRVGPVSFVLEPRDLVALVGPTGSGKTSMLAALAGQLIPAAGVITTPSGAAPSPDKVAWAAQKPLLLPGTLRDNLALAAPSANDDEIADVARRVGLEPLLVRRGGLDMAIDHAGSALSGGERRRIALARAILSRRPALFCDEPTADLDAAAAASIVALLRELANDHAVLVATHDQAVSDAARTVVAL